MPKRVPSRWLTKCLRGMRRTGMHRGLIAWVLLASALLAVHNTRALAEPLGTGASHRGLIAAGPYQIFPENRSGNGVYLDGALLLSLPGQTIVGVGNIAPNGRFLYVARGGDGKRTTGVNLLPGDTQPRISEPAKGYQYVVAGFDGQGYKKFFRVTDAGVTDLLPASRTADGLTYGQPGILFFHVGTTAVGPSDQPAAPLGSYGIRLHWLNLATGAVHHLGRPIFNGQPTLKLAWTDDNRIQYTLTDGSTATLNMSDFK
jgi:hypothetical protein